MTLIAVAQAGHQLYSLSRSSGANLGKLLAAQTEMLRAISGQIAAMDARLMEIYNSVQELREAVDKLPAQTAVEVVQLELRGMLMTAANVFSTHALNQASRGHAYALDRSRDRAELLLHDISIHRNALLSDRSVALCPAVCAAWFIELQLLTSCTTLDSNRIITVAEDYEVVLGDWIKHLSQTRLPALAQAVQEQHDAITRAQRYHDHVCYTGISSDWKGRPAGHQHDDTDHKWMLRASQRKLSAAPAPARALLASFCNELEALARLGVATGLIYTQVAPSVWNAPVQLVSRDSDWSRNPRKPAWMATLERSMVNAQCIPADFADRIVKEENIRGETCVQLFSDTIVNGYFLLVCRETLDSVHGILRRARKTATA
ncbi:MAG TPA: hypothetical protein VFR81_26935 [Longimicrobium sp.]|nr:hypothetical protein [Longimicrobium sp.]